MENFSLGLVEGHFADIVWKNEPMSTKELVTICREELNWQRTTTYTVLKKLCERGLFTMENSIVRAQITRDEFYAIQSENFVSNAFSGSLPAFIASFASRKKLTTEEITEIKAMIDNFGKE